jgi:hypothetical protein
MKDNKHRKELKRRAKLKARDREIQIPKNLFIDGMDSYVREYDALILDPPVHRLLGIFQLDSETFNNTTLEEKVSIAGFPNYSPILWESGFGDRKGHRDSPDAKATGFASCLMDPHGKFHPIIFIRHEVKLSAEAEADDDPHLKAEVAAGIRLLVLLHEIGHAEDMSRQINFDHTAKTMDLIAAEAYTHKFVLNYARKKNYRVALQYYIKNLDEYSTKPEFEEYVRAAAQRVLTSPEMPQFRDFGSRTSLEVESHRKLIGERLAQHK